MAALIGFIVMFLGASIFNIVGGVPFVPLQTLWVNFTTQVFQAIGLGYGEPASDLMERKPRPVDEPILPRGAARLAGRRGHRARRHHARRDLVGRGRARRGASRARWASRRSRSPTSSSPSPSRTSCRSIFSEDTFADRKLLLATGLSALAILFGAELRIFQRILDTVSLSGRQWIACILAAGTIVVVSEVRKFVLRRRDAAEETEAGPIAVEPAA